MQKQQQGYDLFAMQDFIENRGMVSLNDHIMADCLNNPNYVNPLKYVSQIQQPYQVAHRYQSQGQSVRQPMMIQ